MRLHLRAAAPGADDDQIIAAHAQLRGAAAVSALSFAILMVALVPLVPGVAQRLGVGVLETALAMTAYALATFAATVAFWWRGPGPVYWRLSMLEVWTATGALLTLVWASGDGLSPLWLLFVILVVVNALEPALRRLDAAALVLGPVALAGAFVAVGAYDQAGLALCVGVVSTSLFALLRGLFFGLTQTRVERDRLRAEVAELRLRDDRARISRDLHDGLGTELASLVWMARALQNHPDGAPLQREVEELLERLGSATDELRTVVWALRARGRSWEELVDRLRQRCPQLASDGLEVVVDARPSTHAPMLEGPLALSVVRAVQELVFNGARHAGATRIDVSLEIDEDNLRCAVADDGQGMDTQALSRDEGGLHNVRVRVQAVGGTMTVASTPAGTCVRLAVPLRARVSHVHAVAPPSA